MKFNFFKKIWGRKKEEEEKKEEKGEIKEIELKAGTQFKILPLITEKTLKLAQENKYTFLVDNRINKTQIREAIEKIFNVKVENVKTMNYQERLRGVTRIKSKRPKLKKAIVKLPAGQKIPIFE